MLFSKILAKKYTKNCEFSTTVGTTIDHVLKQAGVVHNIKSQ